MPVVDDIHELVRRLCDSKSEKRSAAAKRLRKLHHSEAGPAILEALKKEVWDVRTWKAQFEMILALGELGCQDATHFHWELTKVETPNTIVYVALGDALVRLCSQGKSDVACVFQLTQTDNFSLVDGAFKPNILLIITDQQHAGMLSCAGNRYLQTPNLDSLARTGTRFERAYCGNPVCVPSRFCMLSGTMPSHIGMETNGIGRIGFMKGGQAARWKDEDMADTFTRKGVEFIERNKDEPFFLYFATHDIHVPRVPHQRFVGQTTMGPRGDVIVQFDACVRELLGTLDRLRLTDNTLVILSSDNGPVLDDGYKDFAVEKLGDHKPAGPWRGGKYTIWEGGTRMPFIVRWPECIKPGVSEALVSQVDFCASFAALTGQQLGATDAPDSFNVLPALLGESLTGREYVLEHSGRVTIRQGQWKFIPGAEGGAGKKSNRGPQTEQLYDLANDPAETTNVAAQHPDIAKTLSVKLEQLQTQKGSRS